MLDPLLDSGTGQPVLVGVWQRAFGVCATVNNDERGLAALMSLAGGGRVLAFTWQPHSWPPSWALCKLGTQYELFLTGTQMVKEIIVHLGGAIATEAAAGALTLNAGWRIAFSQLWEAVRPLIGDDCTAFTVSGHSYGGGCAVCAVVQLVNSLELGAALIRGCTFGCPRAVLQYGASRPDAAVVRVSGEEDPVAMIPAKAGAIGLGALASPLLEPLGLQLSWQHFGYSMHVRATGEVLYAGYQDDSPDLSLISISRITPSDHFMKEYLRRANVMIEGIYGR